MSKKLLFILIILLFGFRLFFGLSSEFWFEDELQIYLLGLKFFTTGEWPFFGPDVVYTQSQITGALQALLIGLPLLLLKFPESPYIFLNLMSFAALLFFAWYINQRLPELPNWFVYIITLTTTWMLVFSTHIVNPSYILPFSIIFFISFFEIIPLYKNKILSPSVSLLLMGLCTTLIMQLHLSWVLLMPFALIAFYFIFKEKRKPLIGIFYFIGFLIGMLLIIPTYIKYGLSGTGGTESNLLFNISNLKNFITVLTRYFSLASYEIPYMLGGNMQERLEIIKTYPFIAPSAVLLLITGWLQVALFLFFLIKKNTSREFNIIKIITFSTFVIVFLSFFFSVKGPSPHTFYIIIPIPLMFSFYCYNNLIKYRKVFHYISIPLIILSFILYIGIALYNYNNKSLYKDRNKIKAAIEQKDYKILSPRRSDMWGKGY